MNFSDKSFLIVDDNDHSTILCKVFLDRIGVENIDLAKNGKQAVELASKNLYDVILMDIYMPKKDGVQATRDIRNFENGDHTKIIAYTADEHFDIEGKGFDGIILKPTSTQKLMQSIIDVFEKEKIEI